MSVKSPLELGKRERQIVEAVYRLGEASVAQVLSELREPPSYSSVRAMLTTLVEKKILRQKLDGKRYLYRPAVSREVAGKSALQNLLQTFFGGHPTEALVTLLDASADRLTDADFDRMQQVIEQARQEKR